MSTIRLTYKQRLMVQRHKLVRELEVLDKTILDMERDGVASMAISIGDGQKSATNIDYDKLLARRDATRRQLAAVNRRLDGRGGLGIKHIMTVRS